MTTPAMQSNPPPKRHGDVCGAKLKQARADGRTVCHQPAGWDTSHPGVGNCSRHAGATPSGIKAAARTQAVQLLGTLGVVQDPSSLPTLVVHAELELSAAKQLAAVRWLEQQVGALTTDEVKTSPWPVMLRDARVQADRLLVDLAKLGLDARRVRLEEEQGALVVRVLQEALAAVAGRVQERLGQRLPELEADAVGPIVHDVLVRIDREGGA